MHTRAQMRVRPTIDMFYRVEYLRFFRGAPGGIVTQIFSMVSFFACTYPNRLGIGMIDNPDWFEQIFD